MKGVFLSTEFLWYELVNFEKSLLERTCDYPLAHNNHKCL